MLNGKSWAAAAAEAATNEINVFPEVFFPTCELLCTERAKREPAQAVFSISSNWYEFHLRPIKRRMACGVRLVVYVGRTCGLLGFNQAKTVAVLSTDSFVVFVGQQRWYHTAISIYRCKAKWLQNLAAIAKITGVVSHATAVPPLHVVFLDRWAWVSFIPFRSLSGCYATWLLAE